MKKMIIILIVIAGISVGWYLLAPLWRVEERNDMFPGERAIVPLVQDALETMTPDEKHAFEDAVTAMKDKKKELTETMPFESRTVARGVFVPRAHDVAGSVRIIEHEGARTLRFENFETINGPNLHIYLSKDLSANDFIDLGEIRGTKGNINYEISAAVDTKIYKYAMVWCVPFRVLFSYAELMEQTL